MTNRVDPGLPEESLRQAREREHREIDEVIEGCADGSDGSREAHEALGRAVAVLRWHIYVEEELIFPPLREAGMAGPIMVMLREHAQMWPVLDTLDQTLRDGADRRVLASACQELLVMLEQHNLKEEQILYPQVDRVLGPDAGGATLVLHNGGRVPMDWTCHHLRTERASG